MEAFFYAECYDNHVFTLSQKKSASPKSTISDMVIGAMMLGYVAALPATIMIPKRITNTAMIFLIFIHIDYCFK